nr:MAG TPA: PD-(D/E)XK nuclease superfamily protein [Caudoviricetes sp.]
MLIPLLKNIRHSEMMHRLVVDNELAMDNSMYVNWACPIKGLLAHCLKLRPIGKGSLALDYGTAIHAGLEQFMLGKDLDTAVDAFLKEAVACNIDKWLDDKRCTKRGCETLASWQVYKFNLPYQYEAIDLKINGKAVKAVELGIKKFIQSTENAKHYWTGRVDAIVRYKDKIWVLDHKTSSMLGDKFLDDKMRSNQFFGYWYALNDEIIKQYGEPLAGVMLNVICTGRKDVGFETYEIPFAGWQITEWLEETRYRLATIEKFLLDIYNGENWSMIERELCVTKYGKCPFYEACNTVPNVRANVLENSFEEHNWNPHDNSTVLVME